MTFKEIQELIRLVHKSELTEFKLKNGDFELTVRTRFHESGRQLSPMGAPSPLPPIVNTGIVQPSYAPPAATTPPPDAAPQQSADKPEAASKSDVPAKGYAEIRSPMVGTFYRSSSRDRPPLVKVGDAVDSGTVVCIIEAMKLFNEIESDIKGTIVKVMVEDAQPVEYDQVLFLVDPKG
ncbi:MAG: acetyl-CoA carboxylase biotin carboxyl carrier protein [Saprospiraceae bacterium]|nr:acetyl-CoA carboxylase biotin carboxyl carrier protein [Saprospiraceae bacterium]MDZ4704106.1 acetyl-CoA carboxylase biotin carboxyl carrier protein [Saprospiraceae bacterium]